MTHLSNLMVERWRSTATLCPRTSWHPKVARISHCVGEILDSLREMWWLTLQSIGLVFTLGKVKVWPELVHYSSYITLSKRNNYTLSFCVAVSEHDFIGPITRQYINLECFWGHNWDFTKHHKRGWIFFVVNQLFFSDFKTEKKKKCKTLTAWNTTFAYLFF